MQGCIIEVIPSKKYRIKYDIPGPDGTRKQKMETVKGTRRQAQARLHEVQHTMNTGMFVEPTSLTVGDWLETWLEKYAKVGTTARSYEVHALNLRLHVIPRVGNIRLHQLDTDHLQDVYTELLQHLAPSTVARIRAVTSAALNQAVVAKKLVANPNRAVKLPKNLKTTRTKEMVVYTEEQIGTLLNAVGDEALHIEVVLGVSTGMRLGEVLAVKWDDIDWKRKTLRVDESSEYSQAHGVRLKEPKSKAGRRTIPLTPYALETLRRHRVTQTALRSDKGGTWNAFGLLCPRDDGDLELVATVSRSFERLMRRVSRETGLPMLTFHQLRHTYASLMLHQGTPIAEVSRLLGHESIVTTLTLYAHLIPGATTEAVARYGESIERAMAAAGSVDAERSVEIG
jgi:integrase